MADKKNRGRFTIQFNTADPHQMQAAELLERQGRHKAQFLTGAVLHYLSCKETPDISLPAPPSDTDLKALILKVLDEHFPKAELAGRQEEHEDAAETAPQKMATNELAALLGDDVSSAIANTLAAFQAE